MGLRGPYPGRSSRACAPLVEKLAFSNVGRQLPGPRNLGSPSNRGAGVAGSLFDRHGAPMLARSSRQPPPPCSPATPHPDRPHRSHLCRTACFGGKLGTHAHACRCILYSAHPQPAIVANCAGDRPVVYPLPSSRRPQFVGWEVSSCTTSNNCHAHHRAQRFVSKPRVGRAMLRPATAGALHLVAGRIELLCRSAVPGDCPRRTAHVSLELVSEAGRKAGGAPQMPIEGARGSDACCGFCTGG